MGETKIYWCLSGKHEWERTGPGRPSKDCPEHRAPKIKEAKATTRNLHCALGDHPWEWTIKQGKAPKNCPEHKPEPTERTTSVRSSASTEKIILRVMGEPKARSCKCSITPDMSREDLIKLGGGCTEPQFICPALDSIRRAIGV